MYSTIQETFCCLRQDNNIKACIQLSWWIVQNSGGSRNREKAEVATKQLCRPNCCSLIGCLGATYGLWPTHGSSCHCAAHPWLGGRKQTPGSIRERRCHITHIASCYTQTLPLLS